MNLRTRHWRLMKRRRIDYWNLMTAKTTMMMTVTKMKRRRIDYYLRMKTETMNLRTMIGYCLMMMTEMKRRMSDYWMMMIVMTHYLTRRTCWRKNLKSDYWSLTRKTH